MNKLIDFYTHLITVDTTWNTVTNNTKDVSKQPKNWESVHYFFRLQ